MILAVISAKNDIANQIVLKMAQQADPAGRRTMGKPILYSARWCESSNDRHQSGNLNVSTFITDYSLSPLTAATSEISTQWPLFLLKCVSQLTLLCTQVS